MEEAHAVRVLLGDGLEGLLGIELGLLSSSHLEIDFRQLSQEVGLGKRPDRLRLLVAQH